MPENFFANPDFDTEKFGREIERPCARRSYAIYFTPRSGSSWLTDILRTSQKVGNPSEWLNPNHVGNIAKAINAHDIDSYVAMLRRKQVRGGIFGLETTYYQLNKIFPDNADFFTHFGAWTESFYLIREDIVAQAVSLSKAVLTGVYHAVVTPAEELERADEEYGYDRGDILNWLDHIRSLEIKTEAFFAKFGIEPIRLSYEAITTSADATVSAFFRKLNVEAAVDELPVSGHRRIATEKNSAFATRFRAENSTFMRKIDAARAPLIEKARSQQEEFFSQPISA